jgi:hypothetical protein
MKVEIPPMSKPAVNSFLRECTENIAAILNRDDIVISLIISEKQSTPDYIMQIVCEKFGVTENQIKTKDRHRFVVSARMTYCYLIRRFAAMSYAKIGDMIGGRDHTTVLHSIRTITDLLYIKDYMVCENVIPLIDHLTQIQNEKVQNKAITGFSASVRASDMLSDAIAC